MVWSPSPSAPAGLARRMTARRHSAMLLAIIGICQPCSAIACDTSPACIADIDSFFLPLIANSLTDPQQTGSAAGPVVTPDTDLPADTVVIRPPPRSTAPPSAERPPARRIKLVQRIVVGQISEGGAASLTVHDDAARLPGLADANAPSSDLTIPRFARPMRRQASGGWSMRYSCPCRQHGPLAELNSLSACG